MTKKDKTVQLQNQIDELQSQVNILDRTIHESICVLLNTMEQENLNSYDLHSTISVVVGNLFWGCKQAGVIDD
jgi:hypothetical protein